MAKEEFFDGAGRVPYPPNGQPPSAVRIFPTDHPVPINNARGRIKAEHDSLVAVLGTGYAVDWDDYKSRAGVIQGLKLALEILETVEKELRERD